MLQLVAKKGSTAVFTEKRYFFKGTQIVHMYLGNINEKITWHPKLSKIAQSGHTIIVVLPRPAL